MKLGVGVYPLARKNDEISGVIVEAVAVLVMDDFAGQQRTAQGLLRQVAVSQHPLPTLRVTDIGVDLTLLNALPSSPLLGQHLHFLPREVPNLPS